MCEFSQRALFLHPPPQSQSHLGCLPYLCTHKVFNRALAFREIHRLFFSHFITEMFYVHTKVQPNLERFPQPFLIRHHIKALGTAVAVLSGSLRVNVSNPDLCTRVKSLLTCGQSRRRCSPHLFRENSVKCSSYLLRGERKGIQSFRGLCCPLQREGLFPEEAILVTSVPPTPLLRM